MLRKTLLACVISLGCSQMVRADNTETPIEFDRETLKSLGMDPEVAGYFAREARFLPGKRSVSLTINGDAVGSVIATFNESGQLCIDKTFMEQAKIRLPDRYQDGCYDYESEYPGTIITLVPAQELIQLVLPHEQLEKQQLDMGDFNSGGTAGLFNYTFLTSRNNYEGGHSDYSQLMLDGGLNINDWLFRSHQLISNSQGKYSSQNSQNYLQHTLMKWKTTMKAGEVSLNNRLLEGSSIYGIELAPEDALSESAVAVQVTGIASTAQARVEIRQQGILVYSTLVPAGPFTLTDIPLRNSSSDLNVTVQETDGTQRSFVVPATLYARNPGSPAGYYISAGRVSDNYARRPWVVSASGGWRIAPSHNASGGILVADGYQGIGLSLDSTLLPRTILTLQANQSVDRSNALQGQKYQLTASTSLPMDMALTASVIKKTLNYRDFTQTIDGDALDRNKYEYSLGIGWGNALAGTMSATLYETRAYNRDDRARFVSVNWGKSFDNFSLSANWQRQLNNGSSTQKSEDTLYVNISIPLGRHNINAWSQRKKGQDRYGLTTRGQLTEDTSYSLGTERDAQERQNNVSAGINTNLHYAQLSANASTSGSRRNSYSGTLQGGVVAHGSGVTLSPLAVRETFAIAQLDKPVAGVRLDTPQGPTWTDFSGQAVIPAVDAWKNSRVEISTETLPKNMDIGNGTRMLKQGKGSVGRVHFGVLTQRRVLLNVTLSNGQALPKGVAITDTAGNYLTTSVDDGVIFLNDVEGQKTLIAMLEKGTCRLTLSLPEVADVAAASFYESAKGVCQ
ncbi:fimbrial biogenesis usher protein [Enterobacteriaceae bacterium H4N4]|uniref:Fimbrial biogenesis usher protein n=1 Tax=Silvania confinis TaxID=2926470 RepID=A0A9J6QB89_9ENTR|nr:fimbrial biogenesis usher protein [Silvania confinis]MCU6669791.1 fimbrial biogenesis usher protein [Silvania confinis]